MRANAFPESFRCLERHQRYPHSRTNIVADGENHASKEKTLPQTPQRAEILPSLTGLRFLAAFSVFISHAAFIGGTTAGVDLSYLYPLGAMGVSFFFILSGFVLTYSSRENDSATAFLKIRFFKIFPNHAAVWLGIILMVHFVGLTRMPPGARITLSDDLSNLFLVDTLIPRMPTGRGNDVAWSLTCEFVFYLLFPLLLPLLRRVPVARSRKPRPAVSPPSGPFRWHPTRWPVPLPAVPWGRRCRRRSWCSCVSGRSHAFLNSCSGSFSHASTWNTPPDHPEFQRPHSFFWCRTPWG